MHVTGVSQMEKAIRKIKERGIGNLMNLMKIINLEVQ